MLTIQPVYRPRVKTLDSLRGLAALFVLLNHLLGGIVSYKIMDAFSPIHFLTGGDEAVIFFFLLSGYVLVYQYESNPDYTYMRFIFQRFVRIYIPYTAAIALSVFLFSLTAHNHIGLAWVSAIWQQPINLNTIIDHLILINKFNTNSINPVIWSLVHEMRIALIFPVILYLVRLKPIYTLIILFGISIISTIANIYNLDPPIGYLNSYNSTLHFLYIFVMGGLIAKHQNILLNAYNWLKQGPKIVLILTGLFAYNYAHLYPQVIKRVDLPGAVKYFSDSQTQDLLVTLGSCCFVIAAINANKFNTFLLNRIPLFLGKISYSLYLVHLPVWAFIYFEFNGRLPIVIMVITGFISSLSIAVLFNKYIEQLALKWQKIFIKNTIYKSKQ